jgi:phage-related minor tail protein
MADDELDIGGADSGAERLSGSMKELDDRTRKLSAGANAYARAITAAFVQGASGAKSFDTVLKSLALRLSSLSLNLALKPVTSALAGGIDKLFGGLTGGAKTSDTDLKATAQPFATGGVIASPSYFPLRGGLGLAGEAGPEAIMPLTRGADGKLGVAASGALSQNVTVNIATPDADSFRRSETYLTGLIARAVARGQRGM